MRSAVPTRVVRARTLLTLGFVLVLGTCTGEPTGPPVDPTIPTTLAAKSGGGQAGTVGQPLPQALVVRVTSAAGTGVSGVSVVWSVAAGGGTVSAATTLTDANGEAATTWTLGTGAWAAQTANAAVQGLSGSPLTFSAVAQPGPAARVDSVSGSNQTAVVGEMIPAPLVVVVRDSYGNAVTGTAVAWTVTAGGGSVAAETTTTDVRGWAETRWTVGTTSGAGNQALAATVVELTGPSVIFTASANPGAFSAIAKIVGDNQTGTVGQELPDLLEVETQDEYGNAVPGATVTWEVAQGAGTVGAAAVASNDQGRATNSWILGTAAGVSNHEVAAAAAGVAAQVFTASATPGPPAALVGVSGDAQTGTVGRELSDSLVVAVQDQYGNGVEGVDVVWEVTQGGGAVSAGTGATDATGRMSVAWVLGTAAGVANNDAQADATGLTGSPVSFIASATPDTAGRLVIAGGSLQSNKAGSVLAEPLTVRVTDEYANPVAGVSVRWGSVTGGGTPGVTTSLTDSAGMTSTAYTLGPSVGPQSAAATIPSLAEPQVVFDFEATAGGVITGTVTLASASLGPIAASGFQAPADRTRISSSGVPFPLRAPLLGGGNRLTGVIASGESVSRIPASLGAVTEFVPDELLVTFRADGIGAPAIGSAELAVASRAAQVADAIRASLAAREARGDLRVAGVSPALLAARVRVPPDRLDAAAAQLRSDPAVLAVERNGIVRGFAPTAGMPVAPPVRPTDPFYPWQAWHYAMLDLPRAWDITSGSSDVVVAVVDDGIRFDHPDIAANLTDDGYDFVDNTSWVYYVCTGGQIGRAGDGGGYDADPTKPTSVSYTASNCVTAPHTAGNHGLHVAGTIAAAAGNDVGGVGVASSVRIRPVRVLDIAGSGTWYDVAQGVLYGAGLPADDGAGGTVQTTQAPIINLSLGGGGSTTLQNAVQSATDAGTLLIAAAGNSASTTPSYPAAYPDVISVSAVGPDGVLAYYSNYGSTIDIAAPGGDFSDGAADYGVISTTWNFQTGQPNYASYQGTSMAAPHVSGVAALLLAQDGSRTATELRALVTTWAADIGAPGSDNLYGAGLVNARNALTQTQAPGRTLYARLYDEVTGAALRTTPLNGSNGYAFDSLPNGRYLVFAGGDEDADGRIGASGRPWGAFGGSAAPTVIVVSGSTTTTADFAIGLPVEGEPNNTGTAPNWLAQPGYQIGTISTGGGGGDVDAFRLRVPDGMTVGLATDALAGACGFALEENTLLQVYSPAGELLWQHDDRDASRGDYCAEVGGLGPGEYVVAVWGWRGGGRRYVVRVTEP